MAVELGGDALAAARRTEGLVRGAGGGKKGRVWASNAPCDVAPSVCGPSFLPQHAKRPSDSSSASCPQVEDMLAKQEAILQEVSANTHWVAVPGLQALHRDACRASPQAWCRSGHQQALFVSMPAVCVEVISRHKRSSSVLFAGCAPHSSSLSPARGWKGGWRRSGRRRASSWTSCGTRWVWVKV